jgi:hypothetical protein
MLSQIWVSAGTTGTGTLTTRNGVGFRAGRRPSAKDSASVEQQFTTAKVYRV